GYVHKQIIEPRTTENAINAKPLLRLLNTYYSFFYGPATTQIYTLSLHDALPILRKYPDPMGNAFRQAAGRVLGVDPDGILIGNRSEEHTSELQSRGHLVCRLLLEKKNARLRCGDIQSVPGRLFSDFSE